MDLIFLGSKITVDSNSSHGIKELAPWKESYDKPRQCIKKQSPYSPYSPLCQQSPYSQSYGFSSSRVQMWELDRKEGWVSKNWCFQTVVLESPLDSKEIKIVNLKGNQPWIFTRRTDVKAEAPILWPSEEKNWLIGKDPDAGKDWEQEENGVAEDEMVR